MKNSKQPAYPAPHQNSDGTIQYDVYMGLTKQEIFAAIAMQGILSKTGQSTDAKVVAEMSIECADELLKQLES